MRYSECMCSSVEIVNLRELLIFPPLCPSEITSTILHTGRKEVEEGGPLCHCVTCYNTQRKDVAVAEHMRNRDTVEGNDRGSGDERK